MSKEFTIRPMEGKDIYSIVEAWNESLARDLITPDRFIKINLLDVNFQPEDAMGCFVATIASQQEDLLHSRKEEIAGFCRAIIRLAPNDGLGLEEEDGWIAVLFVRPKFQRRGIGTALLQHALDFLKQNNRKRVWFCGNTGSAPAYVFPGIDIEAYKTGFEFLKKNGFAIDHEPVAMSGGIIDFDYAKYYAQAWEGSKGEIEVKALTPELVQPFLAFLARHFPGDWNAAARAKLSTGPLDEVLVAIMGGEVVGYCQWEGEHFGPFGVRADIRGQKIGAKLFVEAVRRIKAADGRTVWFNWADEDAARFYLRFGLEVTRKFAIMKKDL